MKRFKYFYFLAAVTGRCKAAFFSLHDKVWYKVLIMYKSFYYLVDVTGRCMVYSNIPKFGMKINYVYDKVSKISKTSCLPKRPRQTEQTQIRLLLKKQSDQGLPCLLF